MIPRPGALGPQAPVDADHARSYPSTTSTRSTAALAHGDVACLLMEPALTNIGIVLPDDGLPRRRSRDHPSPWRAVWSTTRRTPSVPGRAAPRRTGASSPTCRGDRQADRRRDPRGGVRHDRQRSPTVLDEPMLGHEIDVAGVGGTLTGSRAGTGRDPGDV
ncbi:MAG: hypothetical protein V9G04_14310 [Nocardioides sp.]